MSREITTEQWLKAVEEAFRPAAGTTNRSARDLAELWNCSAPTAQFRIKAMMAKGLIEYAGREPRVGIDNASRPVPVYRLTAAGTKAVADPTGG